MILLGAGIIAMAVEGVGLYQAVNDLRTASAELRQSQLDLGRSPSDWTAARLSLIHI